MHILHGTARHGTARHGTAQHGVARHGTARHGTTDCKHPPDGCFVCDVAAHIADHLKVPGRQGCMAQPREGAAARRRQRDEPQRPQVR